MTLALYMDHNVMAGITAGCRQRGLDVLTALADGFNNRSDDELLERATKLGRLVFTQDVDFVRITGAWLSTGRAFSGVVFGHQQSVSIRKAIDDLDLICRVLTAEEVANQLLRIPLRPHYRGSRTPRRGR